MAPSIDVRWDGLKEGLTDMRYALLQSLLQQQGQENLGVPMILQLADASKAWLEAMGHKKVDKLKRHDMKMKEARKKKNKGTTGEERENYRNEQLKRSLESRKNRNLSAQVSAEDSLLKKMFHWDYQTLSFDDVLFEQREKLKKVEHIFNDELQRALPSNNKGGTKGDDASSNDDGVIKIPESVLRVMLHHYKWDDNKLIERFYLLLGKKMKKVAATAPVSESKQARKRRKRRNKQKEEEALAAEALGLKPKGTEEPHTKEEDASKKDEGAGVEKLFEEVGVPMVKEDPKSDYRIMYEKLFNKECCNICMDDKNTEKMTALSCGRPSPSPQSVNCLNRFPNRSLVLQ